ncbi:MAG: type I toxin-antitoxin system SymE family toxin [Serratia symbiotica]|nr:type I toxin-antitoxin system SymE family toxin [Serratia symbiotica]
MNITFTPEPIPELTLAGATLAELGFIPGAPFQLTLRPDGLWITPVTDEATWEALCEASQHRPDLGADWVRENGELIIGGDWLSESGITDAEQLEIIAAPGVIRVRRREDEVLGA